MKVAILAGGVGSRLAEETASRPKPMVEIGGKPILWHIMKHYTHYGLTEFVIALGYKGEMIKKFMIEYCNLSCDLTVNVRDGEIFKHSNHVPDWTVHLVDTGLETNTGGRIKRLAPYIGNETFMLTWGDGVSNVDIGKLIDFHHSHGKYLTVTAVRPTARFGHMTFDGWRVKDFSEKPQTAEGWINGAFFVCEPQIFDYIEADQTQWEKSPMERLAKDGQLIAYKHEDFWQCMDTLRDKKLLEELWEGQKAPWKTWED